MQLNTTVYIEGPDVDAALVKKMFDEEGWTIKDDPRLVDVICLTGGSDVSPFMYGETPLETTHSDPVRDRECEELWEKYPDALFVGICRGGQFLNVVNGGTLHQHILGHMEGHDVVEVGTNRVLDVSSDHHQGIVPGDGGEVLLKSSDEIVEACWYSWGASFCYQPHPEWVDKNHECRRWFFDKLEEFMKG